MGNKKKEALVQFNRDNLVEAAKHLFEHKGIEKTTVDDIAKKADYSKSTLYVYFKSKNEIVNYIILEQFITIRDLFLKLMAEEISFLKKYEAIGEMMVKHYQKYPAYFELLLKEIKVTEKDMDEKNILWEIYQTGEEINEVIGQLLKEGMDTGNVDPKSEIFPLISYLWLSISEVILFSEQKKDYIEHRMKMTAAEYREFGFKMLLKSIQI